MEDTVVAQPKLFKEFKEGLETKKQNLFAQIEELKITVKEEVKRLRPRELKLMIVIDLLNVHVNN